MEIVILIMLWLLTCALCADCGYFYGVNKKRPEPPKVTPLSNDEAKKQKRAADELSNFYSYDGTEQG